MSFDNLSPARVGTVQHAPLVYGEEPVALDDPAEAYHEASKLYPSFVGRQTRGRLLEVHTPLRVSSARAVKRYGHLPARDLPRAGLPPGSLAEALEGRRSARAFGSKPLSLEEVATLLHGAYGVTGQLVPDAPAGTTPQLRTAPSAGGLFPLELYLLPWNVNELEDGLHHFDPFRHVLERIDEADHRPALRRACVYGEVATGCGVLILIAAVLWRSRFKYGLRAYRFTLLEAGHVAQNLLLAATALGLGSVPLGGFYDAMLDELLGLDGVNESTLYLVAVGRPADEGD